VAHIWPALAVVLAIHDQQIAEHGGKPGLRDAGLLEGALNRPLNHLALGHNPDVAHLAAVLAHGLVTSHPFLDGNKRVSAVVTELFLELNGYELTADDSEVVLAWLALAAGERDEDAMAHWIREHIRKTATG
jgi:death on curing protein